MSLAAALRGMRPDRVQELKARVTRPAKKLAGTRVPAVQAERESPPNDGPTHKAMREASRGPLALQGIGNHPSDQRSPGTPGKRDHPEFRQVKVYLRKTTHTQAARKCQDAGEGDFSELVQMLLEEYLDQQGSVVSGQGSGKAKEH